MGLKRITSNPIRLRSKKCLLIYNTLVSFDNLMKHLRYIFYIKFDNDWQYLFKTECYKNKNPRTMIYLEFRYSPDIYTGKLNFQQNNKEINCTCWAVPNKDLVLTFLLKSGKSLEKDIDFKTNMDISLINDYISVLDYNFKVAELPVSSIKCTDKQYKSMLKYLEDFHMETQNPNPDLRILENRVSRITNYISRKVKMPEEIEVKYKEVKKILNQIKKAKRSVASY